MRRSYAGAAAIAAASIAALATGAFATSLPFSTSFEAGEGYTNNTQLATNINWTGDGQDSTGWLITNSTIGGSGAASGSQWVLTTGVTATTTKFQWTVTPVTTPQVITASCDVKLVTPAAGTANRSTSVGIQLYDAAVNLGVQLDIVQDLQNIYGAGTNAWIVELISGDGVTGFAYNGGTVNLTNSYQNLKLVWDMATDSITGFVNNVALPDTVTSGGLTDFHDFDMFTGRRTSTSGGTNPRAGFDNYSISVPEPTTLALLPLAAGLLARRRK